MKQKTWRTHMRVLWIALCTRKYDKGTTIFHLQWNPGDIFYLLTLARTNVLSVGDVLIKGKITLNPKWIMVSAFVAYWIEPHQWFSIFRRINKIECAHFWCHWTIRNESEAILMRAISLLLIFPSFEWSNWAMRRNSIHRSEARHNNPEHFYFRSQRFIR